MNTSLLTFALLFAADPATAAENPMPEASPPEAQSTETAAPVPAQPGEAVSPAPAAAMPPPVLAPAPAEPVVEEVANVVRADPTAGWYMGDDYPEHERVLAMPTARALRQGSWVFILDHRAKQPFHADGDPWRKSLFDFGGLDQGLTVGLALRYGILEGLDVGIYRVGQQPATRTDTYEFDARYEPLRQEKAGVDLAVRAGATWFAQYNAPDASGFFGQILADRVLFHRLLVGGGVLYHSSSSNGAKYATSTKYSVAAAAFAEVRVAEPVAISAEVVPALAGYHSKYPSYSLGVKYITSRHTFAFALSNTTYLTSDGYITNSPNGLRDTAIGFNLTREY
jgi:hypothetical protein